MQFYYTHVVYTCLKFENGLTGINGDMTHLYVHTYKLIVSAFVLYV